MINNIFTTLQNDLMFLSNPHKTSSQRDDIERKTTAAALRVLAVLGMGVSVTSGSIAILSGSIFVAVASVFTFTLAHDIFIVCKNAEKGPASQLVTIASNLFSDAKDYWRGDKNDSSTPRHFLAEGTILRPVWDSYLWSLQTS